MNAIKKKQNAIPELKGKSRPYVIAHRGNQTSCPENTLASFKRAIYDGADIIETDIHLTKDDEFVLIHDEFVDRTTDGKGRVSDMTLDELKKLSAGIYKEGFKSEKIPTLRETAKIIPDNVALALELKTDRFLDKNVCARLIDELKEEKIFDRTFVLSFFMPHLQEMKETCPDIYTGWITLDRKTPIKGPDMLGPYWRIFLKNPFYVLRAHLNRQAVCPLDTDPDSRLWFYKMLRCDAVITDNSEITCKKLNKKG
jgi:glycerophosphoryl diester phosphodiesterase